MKNVFIENTGRGNLQIYLREELKWKKALRSAFLKINDVLE